MNNPYEHDPVPDDLQEASENRTGFIYTTYSAVSEEPPSYTPFLQPTDERAASVSYVVGGSVSTVSFDEGKVENRQSRARGRPGGGIRGRVRGGSPG
jgi:hypothetical protein